MNVNELAERESARIVRLLSLSGADAGMIETIRVSVAAAVEFAHNEGVFHGIEKMKQADNLVDWTANHPRINNLGGWLK